ncbi:MAG TPA: hypothetical protein VIV88_00465 [Gemmatimonadales bacterium]|jgi:hypothetical protein
MTANPPSTSVPQELRSLGALLLVDGLLGIWLRLHTPNAFSLYSAAHVPLVGIGGLAWGFLPDDSKKSLGIFVQQVLRLRFVVPVVLVVGLLLLIVSLFLSTVVITTVDPALATTVAIVAGRQESPNTAALTAAESIRLNRLTTPVYRTKVILPVGRSVWLYTPTRVLFRNLTLVPWRPTAVQYPDDFVPMVTIAVLPADSVVTRLQDRDVRLILLDSDPRGDTLATVNLLDHGYLIAFADVVRPSAEVVARWREKLTPAHADFMLKRWQNADSVRARRPLRMDDVIYWQARSAAGAILWSGKLKLKREVEDLYLGS